MKRLVTLPPVTLALAMAAAAALLVLVAVLLPATLFGGSEVSAAPAAVPLPSMPVAAVAPFERYKTIFEKPLFNPGRHADPEPVVAAKEALPALSDYRLVGIMLMGGSKLALVERRSTKLVVTLHPGDDIDGRHVEDIGDKGVRFSGGTTSELLEIPRIAGFSRKGTKDVAPEKKP